MTEPALVDTNVLVRYLAGGPPGLYEPAARLLEEPAAANILLLVAPATISEVVFVLRGRVCGTDRAGIVTALSKLLSLNLEVLDRPVVERGLDLFANNHDDWDDCLVAAYALEQAGGRIASFDRGLDALPGITRIDLGQAS